MVKSRTYGLTHLAVAVSNLERTLKFYQQVFGLQVMYHEKDFIQLTTPGSHDILVFEERQDHSIGKTGGIMHFGFRLRSPEDIEGIVDKVISAGGIIIDQGEFVTGSPYVFFRDPDGYEIEVWYELLT